MSETRLYLDNQSNQELTSPRFKSEIRLRDEAAVGTTTLDWVEPAADRQVTIPDPVTDTEVVLADTPQVMSNKQYSGPIVAPTDMVNKGYVDSVVGSATDATSAAGGGVKGVATYDENFGLTIVGGPSAIARVKVDGSTVQFNVGGQLEALPAAVPVATSAPAGGTLGRVTADTLQGMEITGGGIVRPRVDGSTVVINGSGQLQSIGSSGATGLVSAGVPFTTDIPTVTAPNDIVVGTDMSALEFPKGSTTGAKFEWTVPDDYASGDIEILAVYRMSAADPANQVRLSSQAVIVDATNGTIDSASYPETPFDFTTPTTNLFVRQLFMTIASGDFNAGDQLQVRFKRIGGDVNDLHPDDLQLITFEVRYNSAIDLRIAVSYVSLFSDAAGEPPTTDSTIGADVDVTVFESAADTGAKFQIVVPDHWDEITPASVRAVYAMSAPALLQNVRLETSAEVCDVLVGTITPIAAEDYDFVPPNDDEPHRTTVIREIPASALRRGDVIKVMLARRTAIVDNHPGDFQLIGVTVTFGVVGSVGVVTTLITEQYLNEASFGNPSGPGVSADTDYLDLVDFETYDRMWSSVPAGSLRAAYEGRLSSAQTQVTSIRLNVKGAGASPSYRLRVYAEGTGLVYDGGVQPAPGAPGEVSLTAVDLSAQPAGSQKRFFVEVESIIDAGEEVYVSRPFTRQE
jgi:hypothetical protein